MLPHRFPDKGHCVFLHICLGKFYPAKVVFPKVRSMEHHKIFPYSYFFPFTQILKLHILLIWLKVQNYTLNEKYKQRISYVDLLNERKIAFAYLYVETG